MKRLLQVTLAVLVSAWVSTAPAQAQGSRLDEVLARGKLIVATYSTSPPLAYADANGNLVGFEIDLAKMIAKDLLGDPNKIQFIVVDSSGRFPAVLSGKADFGICSTTIYPERAVRVAFTYPYMDSGVALVVRRDANVHSLSDLNDPKFTITAQNNPQNAERAERYVPKAKTIWFDTPDELFLALKTGRATAAMTDLPIADHLVAENKDLVDLPDLMEKLGVSNNAIFMKPGDFTWWLYLDTEVREMRTGSRYAEYSDLFRKWFGKNPPPQRFYLSGQK